jgi:hypothetical protein
MDERPARYYVMCEKPGVDEAASAAIALARSDPETLADRLYDVFEKYVTSVDCEDLQAALDFAKSASEDAYRTVYERLNIRVESIPWSNECEWKYEDVQLTRRGIK